METRRYLTDLTDAQWELLHPLLEKPKERGGRPRTYPLREIVNTLNYQARAGCSWRMLPKDFPRWDNVYDHFRRWKKDGTLEQVHDTLRDFVRVSAGREVSPSAAVIDSQTVRTTEKGGSVGTTAARRSPGASATSPSTRSG
jgi:putative transposase